MKFNLHVLLCLFGFNLLLIASIAAHGSKTTFVQHTDTTDPNADGFWTRKTSWKARWVKYWRPKAIYVPVWKKVWGPVIQNEWVPLPNAPPGWVKSRGDGSQLQVRETPVTH